MPVAVGVVALLRAVNEVDGDVAELAVLPLRATAEDVEAMPGIVVRLGQDLDARMRPGLLV